MKKCHKLIIFTLIYIVLSASFMGCFNYSEINKITFATSIIFDIDEIDNISVYIDCVRPYRSEKESSDKGKHVIFQSTGKTASEALYKISNFSNNKLNFTQVRAYIFTENAAKKGIDKYLDLINNDVQFGFKPYMFVYEGDINDIVKPESEGDEQDYLGLYLDQLESINRKNISTISSNVNDYISETLEKDGNSLMGSIKIQEDISEKKVSLNGGALFINNKLVNKLNEIDSMSFNLLTKRVSHGVFEIENPQNKNDFITLNIIKSVPNTKVNYENNRILVSKTINITLSISEIQGKLKVNNTNKNSLELNEKIAIEKSLNEFYYKYKEREIDILNLRRLVKQKYPNILNDDTIKNIDLDIEVNINIEGSNLIKNSL